MNSLSNNEDGTSIQDLQQISYALKNYIEDENDNTLQVLSKKLNEVPSLKQRIFSTAIQKEYNKLTLEKMRSIFNMKDNLFKLYAETKLEIARRESDALVASVGMNLQSQLGRFALEKIDELQDTLEVSRTKFLQRQKKQLVALEDYKDFPELYEETKKSLGFERKTYLSTVQELLDGFINALKKRAKDSHTL